MKNFIFVFLFLLAPITVSAEKITEFQSHIYTRADGSFDVTEWITYDFGAEERHGIFRTIPLTHPVPSERTFHERYIAVEVTDVRISGEAGANDDLSLKEVPYVLSESSQEIEIKIGDPDQTISGLQTYRIDYTVSGALDYRQDGTVDLYWNVTGNGWEVPIEKVIARLPDSEGIYLNDGACYRGEVGSNLPCEIAVIGGAVDYGASDLSPGEGLTIARGVDPTKVDVLILERWSLWPLWLVGAIIWFAWLIVFVYRHRRAHRTGATIIAQYEPYGDLKPMYTGALFDGRIDPRDITAGIVYLAEQGFFKIKHVGRKMFFIINVDDYEIVLLRPYAELESDFQRSLFRLMFDESATPGDTVLLSKLAADTTRQRQNHQLITALKAAALKDLVAQGFFEHKWQKPIKIIGYLTAFLLLSLGFNFLIGADMAAALVVSLSVFVLSTIALAFAYRRRTRKGYEALDHLKGFKEFLSVTDKERFKFHNAPQKSPEQFMAFLPYAIAFGVEKEWAEAFKDMTLPQPDWYDGQGTAFNAVYLSQSLGTFGSSVASASTASASSGGGSSGGGAGGGGGGSW